MSSESASGVDGQRSAEAAEANELVLLPRRPPGGACLRREVGPTLLGAATLAPRGRDTTHLAVLVGRVADPVDAGVVPDSFVRLVDHDHLEPAVAGILAAPTGSATRPTSTARCVVSRPRGARVAASRSVGPTSRRRHARPGGRRGRSTSSFASAASAERCPSTPDALSLLI